MDLPWGLIIGGLIAGVDAYQLFTGWNFGKCDGWAYANSPGVMAVWRDSLVEAHDHVWWDTYDPDEADDLGLVSGQEIAHNWGEPDHPQNKIWYCCWYYRYNIMDSGTDEDWRVFRFTGTSGVAHRGCHVREIVAVRRTLPALAFCSLTALAACIGTPHPEPIPLLAVGPTDERPTHYLDWNNVTAIEGLELIQEMLQEAHEARSHTAGRDMPRPEADEYVRRLRELYEAGEPAAYAYVLYHGRFYVVTAMQES